MALMSLIRAQNSCGLLISLLLREDNCFMGGEEKGEGEEEEGHGEEVEQQQQQVVEEIEQQQQLLQGAAEVEQEKEGEVVDKVTEE